MVSGLKIILRGSLFGTFVSYVSNNRILSHEFNPENKHYINLDLKKNGKRDIYDSQCSSDPIIVDFEGDDDPEIPKNWPLWVKLVVALHVCVLNATVYIGSVIYFPSVDLLVEEFGVSQTAAVLPLTLYVIAYGLGPMVFSPLSEHPLLGRNLTYFVPLVIFVILQIPTALVHNFAGLCVLRFLSGFMISPVLATGGGSFSDVFSLPYLPIAMCNWGVAAFCGVSLGPLFGQAVEVSTHGWRWDIWILLIIGGCYTVSFIFFMPETYTKTILYRKAKRITRLSGVEATIENDGIHFDLKTITEYLWRAVVIGTIEPIVLMINIYIGILYAIMYLWFESLPIVFSLHNFSRVAVGCTYLAIIVGCACGCVIYSILIYKRFTLPILRNEPVVPEVFAPIALIGSILLPIGILITGWTGAADIHWFVPLIGVAILSSSSIILFQTLLNYIAMSFPRYVASAFSSNAFARSVLAGCFPLFGRALFLNLKTERFPVAWGSTILAGISLFLLSFTIIFIFYGPRLRASSKYSGY